MTSDGLRDLVESLFMCDAVLFNPIGGSNRDICQAYWNVKDTLNWKKWLFNLKYRYN